MPNYAWDSWFYGPLSYDEKIQGNMIHENGMTLGMRAGPETAESNLLHEMAHFIEIDDARAFSYRWGLSNPKVEIMGRICLEPQTCQDVLREIRVIAIQSKLADLFDVPGQIEENVNALKFLEDMAYVYRHYGIEGHDFENVYPFMLEDVRNIKATLKIDDLKREWDRKISLWPLTGA
jgi:hypothetical protein